MTKAELLQMADDDLMLWKDELPVEEFRALVLGREEAEADVRHFAGIIRKHYGDILLLRSQVEELTRSGDEILKQRDEARELAREMRDWITGMCPDWVSRCPWLKEGE